MNIKTSDPVYFGCILNYAIVGSVVALMAAIIVLVAAGLYGEATRGYPTWFNCGQDSDLYVHYVAKEWPPSLEDNETACGKYNHPHNRGQ